MKMVDTQYYPTPPEFVHDLLEKHIDTYRGTFKDLQVLNFLDPCAGDGAICREVKNFFERDNDKKVNIDCAEIDQKLANSLRGQSFNVVADNFLEFKPYPLYDLIVMNPPFNQGARFLLKAYEHLSGNGKVICILNAETVRNVCTKERELLQSLVKSHGEVSYHTEVFSDAERKTDVEVAVVVLSKPPYENEFDAFGNLNKDILSDEEKLLIDSSIQSSDNAIMSIDRVDNVVSIYRNAVQKIFAGIETVQNIKSGLSYIEAEAKTFNIDIDKFISIILENNAANAREESIGVIRKMAWSYIFKACGMEEFLYTKQKEDFYNKLEKGSGTLPFTKTNIIQFFKNIHSQREELFRQGIVDLFEEITSYHNGNTKHTEGWKTNKNWKINKKIIVQWGVTYSWDHFSLPYSRREWIDDLDKIVRRVDKNRIDNISHEYYIRQILERKFTLLRQNKSFGNTAETPYFHLRFFKKGTLHIVFKDENILAEVNMIGAKARRDLGYDDWGKNQEAPR